MKFSEKLLGQNEHVILHMRTHIKEIIPNLIATIVLIVVAVLAYVYLPEDWRPASTVAIVAVAVTLFLVIFVWPWFNWLTSTYTVTNRRRTSPASGVLTKTGHGHSAEPHLQRLLRALGPLTACSGADPSFFKPLPPNRSSSMTFPRLSASTSR